MHLVFFLDGRVCQVSCDARTDAASLSFVPVEFLPEKVSNPLELPIG